jgi:hypothetical protein
MKPVEGDHSLKNMNNTDEQKKPDEPHPSSSKSGQNPNSPESDQVKDDLFEPTVDMLVNDFDEEQTLEEEEALAAKDGHDPGAELSDLQRESEMPIEELMKLYGCAPPMVATTSTSRKRRRRNNKSPTPPPKQSKKQPQENLTPEPSEPSGSVVVVQPTEDPVAVESPDEDAMTTTTNNLENTSYNDDETNFEDEEEPSQLKKLYTADGDKSDDEDVDYVPDEEEGKKTIMVGSDFQAQIPEGLSLI